MNTKSSFEKCLVYIGAQLESDTKPAKLRATTPKSPSITISRQTGAGGIPIAENLADYLQRHGPRGDRPWTVFDRDLVERVLADHDLPPQLARYMPEDRVSAISDMVEELLGLHPSSWTLLRQAAETILHLAELGNVILVGHGSNVITAQLDNVFHVRLVGSEARRVQLVEDYYGMTHQAALHFMKREDAGRRRFLKRHFHQDIDDPMLYHLVINTDRLSLHEATRLISDAVLEKFS